MVYFGIDLGTAQTLVAKYTPLSLSRKEGSPFELIPIFYEKYEYDDALGDYRPNIGNDEEYAGSRPIMPSIFYLDERTGADGRIHRYRLVGEAAQKRAEELDDFDGKFYKNAKAKLESNCQRDDNGMTPADITYELLKTCFQSIRRYMYWKQRDMPELFIQRQLENIKIGVSTPLATNTDFSKVLLEQARRAAADTGFRNVDEKIRLIEEPTAALANFLLSGINWEKTDLPKEISTKNSLSGIAMVIDLGGGTTDVAVRPFQLVKEEKGINIQFMDRYIARSGKTIKCADNAKAAFGGLDFDDRITAYLVSKFNWAYIKNDKNNAFCYGTPDNFNGEMPFRDEVTRTVRKRIRSYADRLAKTMKEAFTDSTLTQYKLPDIYGLKSKEDPFSFSITVTREEYYKIIQPLLENEAACNFLPGQQWETIQHIVEQTVEDAGLLHLSDLDFVYLTGGTSMMPEVRSWVKKYINNQCPIIWANDRDTTDRVIKSCLTDIAYGVALSLDKGIGLTEYRQSLSNAVMIDVHEGLPKVLIEAGQKCPAAGELSDVLPVESVVGIGIRLYSARDAYSPELRILGDYRMDKGIVIPPNTMLGFRYSLDIDKQLSLTAFYVDDRNKEHTLRLDLNQLD